LSLITSSIHTLPFRLFLAILLFTGIYGICEGSIEISNTTGPLGSEHVLTISSDTVVPTGSPIEIVLAFPARDLRFTSVIPQTNSVLQAPFSSVGINEGVVELLISGNTSIEGREIISIGFKSLVGIGESSEVEIRSIMINNTEVQSNEIDPIGVIEISGNNFIEIGMDTDITPAFPNPFTSSTEVKFSLARESRVQFAVYSIDGRLMDAFPNSKSEFALDAFMHYELLGEGAVEDWNSGNKEVSLSEGNYTLRLIPTLSSSTAGQYLLLMEAGGEKITIGLILVK
jgi:hypothetical protein